MDASTTVLGFNHFIVQSDLLAKCLLIILFAMSVTSWVVIGIKGAARLKRKHNSNKFLHFFRNVSSLEAVHQKIHTHGIQCPFSHLAANALQAEEHYVSYATATLPESENRQEFLIRTMKSVIDEDAARLENGLPILATIAATSPFIGLFGTVWGIYHALIAVSANGASTLEKVAGPVGEALVMTGIGLAVAIPAVIGYNWIMRGNNVMLSRLDSFANELLTFLLTGKRYVWMKRKKEKVEK